MMGRNAENDRLRRALHASGCAEARLWGMKYRAERNPPKAATGGFPYPARTCAEWKELPTGQIVERQMTNAERRRDAKQGSAKLKAAILALAA